MKKIQILATVLFVAILSTVLASCGHIHKFDEWQLIKTSTCTENGEQERYCDCGEKQTQPIAATGHNFGEWQMIKAASCTESGEQERYCDCGEKQHQVILAGHAWIEATCTAPKTCRRCDLTEGVALGHTTIVGYCSRCKQSISPHITLPELPISTSYRNGSNQSTMKITDITYTFDNDDITFTYAGEKTVDTIIGYYGKYFCGFTYKLYDAGGYVVASGKSTVSDISVGDKFKNETFKIYNVSPSTSYKLVIDDYK